MPQARLPGLLMAVPANTFSPNAKRRTDEPGGR